MLQLTKIEEHILLLWVSWIADLKMNLLLYLNRAFQVLFLESFHRILIWPLQVCVHLNVRFKKKITFWADLIIIFSLFNHLKDSSVKMSSTDFIIYLFILGYDYLSLAYLECCHCAIIILYICLVWLVIYYDWWIIWQLLAVCIQSSFILDRSVQHRIMSNVMICLSLVGRGVFFLCPWQCTLW